jgi:two-component system chemotaxis response regulator CheY
VARIAVVDDSKLVRVFVIATLRKAGHETLEIDPDSLQSVLDTLIQEKPDLVVLDHSMPAFEGPSLVRTCFEHPELCTLKVLILTSLHDDLISERMKNLGVGAYLHKPISPEALAESVDRVLNQPPKAL